MEIRQQNMKIPNNLLNSTAKMQLKNKTTKKAPFKWALPNCNAQWNRNYVQTKSDVDSDDDYDDDDDNIQI